MCWRCCGCWGLCAPMGLEGDVVRMFPTGARHSLLAKLGLVTCTPFKTGRKRRFRFQMVFLPVSVVYFKKAAFRLHNYILQLPGRNAGCALGHYFILLEMDTTPADAALS